MINISFYLLTPDANTQSQVYVSISNKEKRLRFAIGESFLTCYCNHRKKKGPKDLIKKNTPFYFDYNKTLTETRDALLTIEIDLKKREKPFPLETIRDTFYLKSGKIKATPDMSLQDAYEQFKKATRSEWSDGTEKHFVTLYNHILEYEKLSNPISLENLNEDFWYELRDDYFVKVKKFSNSTTNKNLKKFKQFLKFSIKKEFIKHKIDLDELNYLDEIEPFKIALKEGEVEALFNENLKDSYLEKVRDLFGLEILTGQRFSDIPKLLDPKHISETNIQIYQQKTGEKVTIPLHPKLKKHLAYLLKKYPEGFPTISNQKFNEYLKTICKKIGFEREHSWVTLSGKTKVTHTDFRYNLITSHTGRRTFCTLALNSGINPEMIMKVTGHRKYDQFREYVKVDDADINKAFEGMFKEPKIVKPKKKAA